MAKRTTLLATVALPIFSLVWQPVEAAMVRPVLPQVEKSDVTTVQSEEEEIIRKKRNREEQGGGQNKRERNREAEQQQDNRQERRKKQREAEGDQQQQENRQERRKKQREAEGDQQQQENRQERRKKQREAEGDLQQQENRQERRKKQREAEADQQQQENRQERRKKQREAEADQQQQENRQERRKKQREAEADQQQEQNQGTWRAEDRKDQREREADRQKQENTQKTREERRQKQRDAEADQQRQDADQQRAREERRKKQREAEANQKQDDQKVRQERREKQREAEREGKRPDETAGRPRRERDKDRERIARDPSGTTDTIELPFTDGAAVLDSDKDWDNRRDRSREELRRERREKRREVVRIPESDRDAQVGWEGRDRVRYESGDRERGERRDRRPRYDERDGWRVEREIDDRTVINFDGGIIVRSDDGRRLSRRATETYYEDLPNGRVREVIVRPNGDRVVTIRNRYGDIIQRSRIDGGSREYVMYYAPEIDRDSRPTFVDPGERLPPMRLTIPVDEYIIDTSAEDEADYRDFLERPPVEPVERVYTLDEVKYSARIRDKVRRIDLDTITFATGSADISMNQASTLKRVADAMNEILDKDPGETFLIEGHTDAVGSDQSNLVLSDERAEAVANILTDVYDIAPENLATQGYGERFLKIDTDASEQLNRRVTIRRVTPLVKPVAMAE
ncbi:OmpA family protein [Shinella sp. CPCC 100929]|uniref:OmpA family protein n=1 Tax=Shinella lacus TaxID=2654216 RepID=A0ABT1R2N0_9HYPH|nr:OmpA family protein [Shinella lacus]MCQ4629437.1 OmpA family protein [Shinella lacus]